MRVARPTALLLTLGLVLAVVVAPTARASNAVTSGVRSTDSGAFIAQPGGSPPSAARLERDHRRESVASQRWTKHPLSLFAVIAALFAVLGPSVRRARGAAHVARPPMSWWFRSGGRAPPALQLSVT